MAKQKGIIKLDGTLDDITFYFRKGVAIARKSGGGFNGKAIKQSSNMQRVRENSSEFGNVSKIKKLMRLALEPYLKLLHDTTQHGRMMGLLQEIKVLDTLSERGKRTVFNGLKTPEGRALFTSFSFTPNAILKDNIGGNYSLAPTTFASLEISNLNKNLTLSASATSVQLQLVVVTFDFEHLRTITHQSTPISLSKANTLNAITLELPSQPDLNNPNFVFLHFQEVQELNGVLYPLKAVTSLELICLDVIFPVV
ncbi:hypothetical protein [Flavobacterium sp.]|uniref:hypothetical protein n=1 Tax=Flavobacterium sp. TaxID=239 RepID=UPI0028BE9896|nr:hypothetical protein [Flavobacterium sp.]